MHKRILLTALACVVAATSFGQTIIINGNEGDRTLTWKDFKGRPERDSEHGAMTYWSVKWKYDKVSFDGNYAILDPEVTVVFGADSWVRNGKTATAELLKHEQGHFDIARLYGLELTSRLRNTTFYRHSYKDAVRDIYYEVDNKYRRMQHAYDEETDNHRNTNAQARWNHKLQQEFARYAIN